jgi:hypothetical protein
MRPSFLALAAALLLAPAVHALPVSFSGGTALTIVGGYSQSNPLAAQFGITNTSGQDLTLGLERQIISAVPGSENNFCFGTGCYPPTVSIAPLPITLVAGATDNTFVGDYSPNNYSGVTRIRYAFYDVNGAGVAADTAYVTVTYDASQRVSGLAADLAASTLLGAPAPNPAVAGAEVRFSLDAAAPKGARLHLIDLRDGRTVGTVACEAFGASFSGDKSSQLADPTCGGACGVGSTPAVAYTRTVPTAISFSTAGLAAGVYGCQLVDSKGTPRAMRRLVVQ